MTEKVPLQLSAVDVPLETAAAAVNFLRTQRSLSIPDPQALDYYRDATSFRKPGPESRQSPYFSISNSFGLRLSLRGKPGSLPVANRSSA